jgi:hypothetical protein
MILMASWLLIVVQVFFMIQLFFSTLGNMQTLREAIASRLPGREPGEGGDPCRP